MTVFRILPTGHRRRLPDGSVRALGANGSRYFDVVGSTSLGVDTGGVAFPVVPMVGQTWLTFALAGTLTLSGTVGRTTLSIGVAGALSSAVSLRGASLLGVNLLGNLTPAVRLYGNTGIQFAAAGRLLPSVPVRGLAELSVDVIGQLSVAAVMRGQVGLGIGVYGSLTAKAGQKWRDLWLDVYDTRQALLNAIDANNRYLAKSADGKAQAAADAIVQTNIRVDDVEDGVVAEAQRITVLTSRVGNVEGTQVAQGSAISNLQTTSTQQGNQIAAQGIALTSVSAKVSDTPNNIVKKADFSDDLVGEWGNATVGTAPSSGWGSQPTSTYRGKYLTTTDGDAYEYSWTPCSPGDVYEISANLFSTTGEGSDIGGLGIHFQTPPGVGTFSTLAKPSESGVWESQSVRVTVPAGVVRMRPWLTPGTGNIRVTQPRISKISAISYQTASAVQILDAKVTVNEQGIAQTKSTWGVYLTAGNLISGVQSINDGTIAEFNVSANVFRVMSPSGAPSGMEWQNGYLRSWKEDTQVIMGNGFGASNDLMFYAGPNVGVSNATKANAVFWIDSNGVGYFAGEVLQGTLRNFQSNTTVSNTATVSTGSVARKGKEVAVTGRFQYQYMQSYQGLASQITLAGGNTVATICIEYRYGTGAWVELSRVTIAGNDYVLNESEAPSVVTQSISGQVFATASASTTNTEFRTRVISIELRQHTVTNPGTVPPAVRSQYQSIESLE